MDYTTDPRIVMTLDAGGTNLVFNAVKSAQEILEPITLPARANSLEEILRAIIKGFELVQGRLNAKPSAICFAFPGPADYEKGIIGDLQNLPFFRGGVALGPMLEEKFQIPVFILNDGDLFTFGEAKFGLLPQINAKLRASGNPREYRNLLGVTFGTGFGGGIVTRDGLLFGDNSAGGEINRTRNRTYKNWDAEETVSIRGLKREFANFCGVNIGSVPEPKDIFAIGMGQKPGNREAAIKAYRAFAVDAADAIANAATLVDGLIVIGGGLSGAWPLFMPKLVEEMNLPFATMSGHPIPRMEVEVYNLEEPEELAKFLISGSGRIQVPLSRNTVQYDPSKKIGVGVSRLGTSAAVSLGAYAFALSRI
jgi:glucokinase